MASNKEVEDFVNAVLFEALKPEDRYSQDVTLHVFRLIKNDPRYWERYRALGGSKGSPVNASIARKIKEILGRVNAEKVNAPPDVADLINEYTRFKNFAVFISYRRADSTVIARRIHDRLAEHFGAETIQMDSHDIPLGVDFKKQLQRFVQWCDVLLVIIGPLWLNIVDSNGKRRLDNPADFVRLEIEGALKRGRNIYVIPVAVEGATLPSPDQLPPSLAGMAYRNGITLHADHFEADMAKLIEGIEPLLPRGRAT
ncbi:MAG: toll/interleukin-1 receptor domain-containing protein [Anaerolineae bacterium]|nr:toll/interleukin-1 receptor domain-containing protein [Anaerolineae bacterium]